MQYTTIITDLCPDLGSHDFNEEASLYNLILTKYKLPIARIDQTIGAVLPTNGIRISEVPGDPLLLVNTTAYLENGEPLEASTSYYRADKYEFSVSQNYW